MPDSPGTVVVHQPDFVPYLGFFQRLLHADVWVVLDHVQFNKEGWVHRDKIKTPYGVKWISIPLKKHSLHTAIMDLEMSENAWRTEHLRKWHDAYRKALHYKEAMDILERMYACETQKLSVFTRHSIDILLEVFDVCVPRVLQSCEMRPQASSNALVAELVVKAGGQKYLSGTGAQAYFDPTPYLDASVQVNWQKFLHPVYPQLHGPFEPFLSSMDSIFNCGTAEARRILHAAK